MRKVKRGFVILPVTLLSNGRLLYSISFVGGHVISKMDSENRMLDRMETLLTSRLQSFEEKLNASQRQISDTQLNKIQQNFVVNNKP